MNNLMKVLLVEDETLVRRFIRTLINWEVNGFSIVGEASNGEEAWDILKTQSVDIVLTDIRMPVLSGFELIELINDKGLSCEVVILSSYDDFEYVRTALRLRVCDYVHKATISELELQDCLNKARRDWLSRQEQTIINRSVSQSVLSRKGVVAAGLLSMALNDNEEFNYLELIGEHLSIWNVPFQVSLANTSNSLRISELEDGCILVFAYEECWIIAGYQGVKEFIEAQSDVLAVHSKRPISFAEWPEIYLILKRELEERLQHQVEDQTLHTSVRKAIAHIQEHYMDELTLEMMGEHVHISPAYLSRLFQRETGTTFTDYLTTIRINQAKYLLSHTDFPAYAIAERVGYRNSRYFLKLFKETVGSTTTEYRDKIARKMTRLS